MVKVEKMPDSKGRRKLLVFPGKTMMVIEAKSRIEDASDADKAYLAGVVDSDGHIGIKGSERKEQLIIEIAMEDLLPYDLCNKYGGGIYNRYNRPRKDGSRGLSYEWYVGPPKPNVLERKRKFIVAVGPFSRVKSGQFELMLEAVDIKIKYWHKRMPDDVARRMTEIKERIHKLNHTDPPYIKLESRPYTRKEK